MIRFPSEHEIETAGLCEDCLATAEKGAEMPPPTLLSPITTDLPMALYYAAGALDAAQHGHRDEAVKCARAAVRAAYGRGERRYGRPETFAEDLMYYASKLRPHMQHGEETAEIAAATMEAARRLGMEF